MAAAPLLVVKELLEAVQQVANPEPLVGPCQKKNSTVMVRRVRLLLPILEEVRDNKMLLPPSAVAAFQELHSIMSRAAEVLHKCRESSQLWLLAECQEISNKFFEISRDMAIPLSTLPMNLLDLPIELKEQIELLKLQARRAKPFVDPVEEKLHEELMRMLQEFEKKKTPSSDRIDALFRELLLVSSKDCQRELQLLQKLLAAETKSPRRTRSSSFNRNSTTSATRIGNLVNFLCYSSCVLYGMIAEAGLDNSSSTTHQQNSEGEEEEDDDDGGGGGGGESGDKQVTVSSSSIPDEYKCPISLELMRDPVIIATGQTYDRTSIQRWVEAGNLTCPKTGQKLIHMTLIPNYALRSLIAQWCEKNRVPFQMPDKDCYNKRGSGVDHIANSQATMEAAKMTASFLVGKLAMGSLEIQKQAAYELRLLAKSGMENRKCIAEAGAIPFLVSLLYSRDATTQENAITALLNLSIFDNNKSLIMSAGALDPIVDVLCNGHSTEARENAAATIFSLSTVDENKAAIGDKESAIPMLVELLSNGTQTGKKDAVSALFNLSLFQSNKAKVVNSGAVEIVVEILHDAQSSSTNADLVENCLALLGLLAASEEGVKATARASAMPNLVRILESGSQREKENAAAVLLALCKSGNHAVMRCLMAVPGSISALHSLLANGSSRSRRKAASLMKILHNWDPSSSDHPQS